MSFLYSEAALIEATGIHARVFQKMRGKELVDGADWALVNQHVAYSKKGLARAVALATGEDPEKSGAVAGIPLEELEERCLLPEPDEAPPVMARVTRFYLNRFMLGVTLISEKKPVNIRVNSTANFRKGMEIPLRWNETVQAFELDRKLPRSPGRW